MDDVTYKITLTDREVTLIRVALTQRVKRLEQRGEKLSESYLETSQRSYLETKAMLGTGGVLALDTLAKIATYDGIIGRKPGQYKAVLPDPRLKGSQSIDKAKHADA